MVQITQDERSQPAPTLVKHVHTRSSKHSDASSNESRYSSDDMLAPDTSKQVDILAGTLLILEAIHCFLKLLVAGVDSLLNTLRISASSKGKLIQ